MSLSFLPINNFFYLLADMTLSKSTILHHFTCFLYRFWTLNTWKTNSSRSNQTWPKSWWIVGEKTSEIKWKSSLNNNSKCSNRPRMPTLSKTLLANDVRPNATVDADVGCSIAPPAKSRSKFNISTACRRTTKFPAWTNQIWEKAGRRLRARRDKSWPTSLKTSPHSKFVL